MSKKKQVARLKLAIVGSGIGGCSTAYFTKELIPEDMDITIFEANDRIGGRLLARKIGPVMVELGGTFFHTINQNLLEFVKKFSLETEEFVLPVIGVWNGSKFIYKSSKSPLVTNLRLLLRYRLGALRLQNLLKKSKKEVLKLYANNRLDFAYETCEELIDIPFILDLKSKTLENVLLENGVSSKLIKEILEPGVRYIYHQSINIGGFAGIVTIVASDGTPLYKLKNGNVQFNKNLVKSADATVKLKHKIEKIIKTDQGKYNLINQEGSSEEFDAVILAAPFEQLQIEFENITLPEIKLRKYRKVFIKLITGSVNPQYFGLQTITDVPELLLTTADFKGPFDALETLGKTENGQYVYNLFAIDPITDDLLQQMFSERIIEEDYIWEFAHPIIKPFKEFQPFILDTGLFNINTIESAASTLETTIVAAKNVALLLKTGLSRNS